MMQKIFGSAALFFFSISAMAQQKSTDGVWTFEETAKEILHINFLPKDYITSENITGAVLTINMHATDKKTYIVSQKKKLKQIRLSHYKVDLFGDSLCIHHLAKTYNLKYQLFGEDNRGYRIYLEDDEKIFGGGERALPLNRRGYKFPLYNNPWYGYSEGADALNYSVPFITSSRKYGIFFDNAAKGYIDIETTESRAMDIASCSGALDLYLIPGNDYPEVLASYHFLTGTQPLLPRWALGSFMSRFGYTSETQTRSVFQQMKQEKIPFDAIIFDLFWFGDSIKKTLGNLDWVNASKWPQPAAMIHDFKKDSIETILVTEPFVLEGTKSYEGFKNFFAVDSNHTPYRLTDFYFGYGGLIDMFRQDAKDHFWSFYQKQMEQGVEGWWGDLGEPEKHPTDLYHNLKDMGQQRLFNSNEVHNVYGHNWTKMLYEKYKTYYPDKRLFSLNRSGFAGTQRYGIVPWSGDVSRSWSGLRAQLPIMLGMSMSGVPYIHADAGGFAGGDGDWELYIRWLQFAVFTPIFRPHGTALYDVDPNAFSFPSEIALADTNVRERAKQAAMLRYRMLPYNYSLCYRQTTHGEPLVSPLYYYYSADTATYSAGQEYMWGKDLLIAPVLYKDAINAKIYLPRGEWYRWNENVVLDGGRELEEQLTTSSIPVFVKAGSIVPLIPQSIKISNTKAYNTAEVEWHYYAGNGNAHFELFDDDGVDPASIANKNFERITVEVIANDEGYSFTFDVTGNAFTNRPSMRMHKIYLHGINNNLNSMDDDVAINQDAGGIYVLVQTTSGKVNFKLKRE